MADKKPQTITRTIKSAQDLNQLILFLQNSRKFPLNVTIKPGTEPRTVKQNRLMWQWFLDAERQGDQTAAECRAYCKLHFGVPLLRAESEAFREQYDAIVRPLPYDQKLALMLEPIELPVTSLMSVKTKTRLLDQIWCHFTGLGMQLTDPALLGMEDWREVAA